ncbi:hypothetical protein BH11VER1_BH11VER1_31100 [soil metagenome]
MRVEPASRFVTVQLFTCLQGVRIKTERFYVFKL